MNEGSEAFVRERALAGPLVADHRDEHVAADVPPGLHTGGHVGPRRGRRRGEHEADGVLVWCVGTLRDRSPVLLKLRREEGRELSR